MHVGYFTERPHRYVSNDEIIKNGFFGLPNTMFERETAARYLNEYLDERVMAEELGFDGLMLNEHHDNAFCMGSVMNVEASILARLTKKVKIVLLGNPLPIVGNPLRLAEELAMIDLISGGRLVSGWVRGAGSEQFATNANPAFNREYFDEAHEVIMKAWTQPGPFRYEGKHFHYRYVNPWMLPLQKPHPQIWIPGLLSPETVEWCAQASLSVRGAGHLPGAHRRTVGLLPRRGGQGRLPGRDRELRLSAKDLRGRDRREGPRNRQVGHVRRRRNRLQPVLPAAMDRSRRGTTPRWRRGASPSSSPRRAQRANPPRRGPARRRSPRSTTRERISGAQVDHRSATWQQKQLDVECDAQAYLRANSTTPSGNSR